MQNSGPKQYCVNINRLASKDITRIPKAIASKILAKIAKLQQNPFPSGCKKVSTLENGYRLRQGDYRILYVVDASSSMITVVAISHRKNAYRNISD
ncbi:MAG: type II toxin-antitoxin system RelE/ParE family toxin [Deltaproteobacteria bacterium]|nr:type II toxin-antitoxin system RelE/ParE family toxin [Deltaproteobacteria bacterium]